MDNLQTAVLTGATGILGTALIDKLLKEKVDVYVICHPGSPRNKEIRRADGIHLIECDLSELSKLPQLVPGPIDAFYHFGWLGTSDPLNRMDMLLQVKNIQYALDALNAANALACKVFIGAGSQAEYGRIDGIIHPDSPTHPVSGYGMAKLCAGQMTRQMCRKYGIRHIWPRIVSVYGLHERGHSLISTVIDKLLAGEKPSLTKGEQIWDYLYAEDAADAFYRMAVSGKDGAVYVLGSGQTRSLRHFMESIRDAINPSLPLGIGEVPYYPDQAMHLEADISNLTQDTGWRPKTTFEEGIRRVIEDKKHAVEE